MSTYICPICNEGTIVITSERTGAPGFRMTDYNFGKTTCDCITYKCEATAIAVINSADRKLVESDICQECHTEKATIHYPVKSWAGEYKDICPSCFKKKMEVLEAEWAEKYQV